MQWSFLVIYAKTIFSNISLANKTTSPIQNGRYKIDLRCSHDLLIDTISEVEHCKHQYLYQSNTNSPPGAAMTCWLTPSQRWSIASPIPIPIQYQYYPIQSNPIPIPNQVQPWRAGGHHLRDGALHHQDRHRRWFLPGVMLLTMFMVMVFRNF